MALRRRRVSEIMRREVVTATPEETLDLTQDLMRLGRVRHLPVVEGERLVGIVSSRDLLETSLSKVLDFDAASRRGFLRSVEIAEVMTRDPISIGPDTTLEEAARTIVGRKIGCLPVVGDDGHLLGLVTETDLIEAAYLAGGAPDEPGRTIDVEKGDFSDWMQRELEELRRMRDERRVQAHLGRAEARDQWDRLEKGFASLEERGKRAARAAGSSLRDLEEDARKLARDLREGYRRIRDSV